VLTDDAVTFPVQAQWLKQQLNRVMFAASDDDGRPVLQYVLWRVAGGDLTLVATDGFRLALVEETDVPSMPDFSTLLPTTTLAGILQLLDGEVAVTINCNLTYIFYYYGG
jgi:DNA polymerase-3 subunit beta